MVIIRRADAADQRAIVGLVRAARINPIGLAWSRFIVAEQVTAQGRAIVGTGQLKPQRDGSLELASLAVAPSLQGQGIGAALVQTLLSIGPRPIYLLCRCELVCYYARFGFVRAGPGQLPPAWARRLRWGEAMINMVNRLARQRLSGAVMRID